MAQAEGDPDSACLAEDEQNPARFFLVQAVGRPGIAHCLPLQSWG